MRTKRTVQTSPPLVDLDYLVNYLNVDQDNATERVLLGSLINAAVLDMEAFCSANVVLADFEVYLTSEELVDFRLHEATIARTLAYRNVAGVWTVLTAETDYTEFTDCGVVRFDLIAGPTLGEFTEVYRVTYQDGFTAATLPENAKLGLMLHVSYNYDVRMDEGLDPKTQRACEVLWRPLKNYFT